MKNSLVASMIISIFLLTSCSKVMHLAEVKDLSVSVENPQVEDPQIGQIIAPYKEKLDSEMNEVIGQCTKTLIKARPESGLGNWIGDCLFEISTKIDDQQVDFAVQNYGGIRVSNLVKGPVTKGKIFELMPFDNSLVVIDLDFNELSQFIQQMARSGGWPGSSQLKYVILNNQAIDITVGGNPIDSNKIYRVAMPDYIADGGDAAFFLKDNPRKDLHILIRDAIIAYIRTKTAEGVQITAVLDGRIKTQ